MVKDDLLTLESKCKAARVALDAACKKIWPEGITVAFIMSHKQKNPTYGNITGWWDGYATIRLENVNRRGNHTVKHVYFKDVQERGAK